MDNDYYISLGGLSIYLQNNLQGTLLLLDIEFHLLRVQTFQQLQLERRLDIIDYLCGLSQFEFLSNFY